VKPSPAGKVYVSQPMLPEAIDFLKTRSTLQVNPEDRVLPKTEFIENVRDADAVVTLLTDVIDAEVLESAPSLKVVANVAVGFNNIDVKAATRLGIAVTNTPGVLTETSADFAWTLMMAAARRLGEAERFTRDGKFKTWGLQTLLGRDVHGKTLGIVGFGRIGRAVAQRARGFAMRTVYVNRSPIARDITAELQAEEVSFEELLRVSDFITLHVPLDAATRHLLDDRAFARMKPDCVLVNTSRGPVIDEKALVRALKTGKIAAAGLDVYENEPQIEPELFDMENVVLAPHIGSASRETRLKMCMMAAENLMSVLNHERPVNLVNSEVWAKRRR
jgi:glyoxylate reductase